VEGHVRRGNVLDEDEGEQPHPRARLASGEDDIHPTGAVVTAAAVRVVAPADALTAAPPSPSPASRWRVADGAVVHERWIRDLELRGRERASHRIPKGDRLGFGIEDELDVARP